MADNRRFARRRRREQISKWIQRNGTVCPGFGAQPRHAVDRSSFVVIDDAVLCRKCGGRSARLRRKEKERMEQAIRTLTRRVDAIEKRLAECERLLQIKPAVDSGDDAGLVVYSLEDK